MAQINRSNLPSLLRPGLKTVFGNYNVYPDLWKDVYSIYRSDKAVEYDMEMQGLGLAQLKADGSPVAMGSMMQGYQTSYTHQFFGIGYNITRGAVEDNLYEAEFPQQSMQLRHSLQVLKNINCMYQFNNAFNQNSAVSDGQPLCSTAHPISTGQLANRFTNAVQLNEASLEDAITLIKGWQNLAGLQINVSAVKLLVPQKQAFNAARLLKSSFRTGTANNDISAIVHDKYMPGGYIINQFITNPNYWFILTDEPNGFKYFQRTNLDIDFIMDPNTDNTTVRAIERYSPGCSNWRATFGAFAA